MNYQHVPDFDGARAVAQCLSYSHLKPRELAGVKLPKHVCVSPLRDIINHFSVKIMCFFFFFLPLSRVQV